VRVLHVLASSQLRGAETFAADLDKALAWRGVDQRVAVLRPTDGARQVHFQSPRVALGPGGGLAPVLRLDLLFLRSLRRVISAWKPDIVQAHGGETLKYAVPACGRRASVVYRRIGSTPEWMAGGLRRAGHRAFIRRAARIVAVGEAVRAETIERFGIDPERVVTIPNGVDIARATPNRPRSETRARLGIERVAPVVISVGAFTVEKDPDAHVEVARRVIERRRDTVFLLVGDGPLMPRTMEKVSRYGLEKSIRFLGPSTEIPDLLAASDIALLASRTEGMPGILIEAGIAGIPAAAYAIAGVPEVIVDRLTGLLAPPGDVGTLTSGVLALLEDARCRRDMGEAARELCTSRFDISLIAERYLSLYEELAESRSLARAAT